VKFVRFNICATQFVNDLDESVIYDFNDFGGTVEWLSGECVERQGQNIGSCIFGSALANPAYIVFVVLFLFSSQVKLNQLSPLVSLTRVTLANNLD